MAGTRPAGGEMPIFSGRCSKEDTGLGMCKTLGNLAAPLPNIALCYFQSSPSMLGAFFFSN